jgi:hypothetical protein
MVAAYINKETEKEIYVSDFTAVLVEEKGKRSEEKVVIYSEKDNSTTFVMLKSIFDKEYVLKNN